MAAVNVEFWNNQLLTIACDDQLFYTHIVDADHLSIQHPVNKYNYRMPLSLHGERVSVFLFDDYKNMYTFQSVLKLKDSKLTISRPDVIKKVQRRKHFRIQAMLQVMIMTQSDDQFYYTTVDISGGGILFHCHNIDDYTEGDCVTGCIYLDGQPDAEGLPFTAMVVRKDMTFTPPRMALAFTNIKERHREKIVRFCLSKQRELRNRLGLRGAFRM